MADTYYNEQLKQEFIDWKNETTIVAPGKYEKIFKDIKKKEIELDKDCCNFTADEIIGYYKERNLKNVQVIANIHSALSLYTDWCFKKMLLHDGQNHYRELVRTDLKKCINNVAKEKREIVEADIDYIISQMVNDSDKFIIQGLWEGLLNSSYSDLAKVKLEDFKPDGLYLPSGRKIAYSQKLYSLAQKSAAETEYEYKNGLSNSHKPIGFLYGETVIRSVIGTEDPLTTENVLRIRRRMGRRTKEIFSYVGMEKWMTAYIVRDAAVISYIKKKMLDGYSIKDIRSVDSVIFKEISNQWNISSNVLTNIIIDKFQEE